jgi:hypothetical protein
MRMHDDEEDFDRLFNDNTSLLLDSFDEEESSSGTYDEDADEFENEFFEPKEEEFFDLPETFEDDSFFDEL